MTREITIRHHHFRSRCGFGVGRLRGQGEQVNVLGDQSQQRKLVIQGVAGGFFKKEESIHHFRWNYL
jgi:hypothetical protein